MSIGILADTSGSMELKLQQLRAAISQFISNLNGQDDVFLFAFSDRPFLLQPFTTNHFLVRSRLALLHAYGQTALFDTIMDGLIMVRHGRYDKKALLVVTDGMDNASQATLQQVVGQARRITTGLRQERTVQANDIRCRHHVIEMAIGSPATQEPLL